MRVVQVVPFWNVDIALLSVALGSLVHCLEKHRMYSCRLSPSFYLQFRSSHSLLDHAHVPWKLPMKVSRSCAQLLILSRGKCSSQVRAD